MSALFHRLTTDGIIGSTEYHESTFHALANAVARDESITNHVEVFVERVKAWDLDGITLSDTRAVSRRKAKDNPFAAITCPDDLSDPEKLQNTYEACVQSGTVPATEYAEERFRSLAAHALRNGDNPVALFIDNVRNERFDRPSIEDERNGSRLRTARRCTIREIQDVVDKLKARPIEADLEEQERTKQRLLAKLEREMREEGQA